MTGFSIVELKFDLQKREASAMIQGGGHRTLTNISSVPFDPPGNQDEAQIRANAAAAIRNHLQALVSSGVLR